MTVTLRVDHARVVPCADRSVIDDASVVVEGDTIVWIGPTAAIPAAFSQADLVLDATGRTVLPGLVDAHMHISFGEAASEEELSLHTPPAYRAIRASVDAATVLAAGVTSACDPGGPRGIATAVRDAIASGLVEGPRLAAAGRQITTQQGIGDTLPAPLGEMPTAFGAIVRSTDEIVQEIRNEVKDGVDLIKVAGSGPGTAEYGAFARHELEVAVTEAHRLDRPITIHARSRASVADAVAAGFDWIMHASYMDSASLDGVLSRDIPIVPAMTLLVNTLEAGADVLPLTAQDAIRRELDSACGILSKAYSQGATLIAGSETGFAMTPYGEWHTREMELFVELLGMDDIDALLAMTRNAARAIPGFGSRIGILAAGRLADLLIVDGEPDRDIRVLADRRRIDKIVKAGKVVSLAQRRERTRLGFERTRMYTSGVYRRPGRTR